MDVKNKTTRAPSQQRGISKKAMENLSRQKHAQKKERGVHVKATKIEAEMRRKTVTELLLLGKSREEILLYSAEKWGLSEEQTNLYLSDARKRILSVTQDDIAYFVAEAAKRYDAAYELARSKGDYHGMVKAAKSKVERLCGKDAQTVNVVSQDASVETKIVFGGKIVETDTTE